MIGIIGAMDIEVNGIIEKLENPETKTVSNMRFTTGRMGAQECVISKCGIGKVNAAICAQTMILLYHPDCIINTGIAGSTSEKTHIGSVVIAERTVQHDMNTEIIGDERGTLFFEGDSIKYIPCDEKLCADIARVCSSLEDIDYTIGTVATGDIFIGGIPERKKLNQKFDALACEMEGGSIGQVCYLNNVPFCILRCISDDSTNDAEMEYSAFSELAAKKSIEIITEYLRKQ